MATPQPSTAASASDQSPDPGRPAGSEAYRSQAGRYDQRTDAFRRWRELVVEHLPAYSGDTVLDVGCGTGLCLPLLQRKVGPSGTIVGIDASAQMLEVAGARVTEHGCAGHASAAAFVARPAGLVGAGWAAAWPGR
jgi:demethylmenaquinone methyltransferase/2-methoxy-6-polyprenyl-1,4-benzoquinol methylase